jgi:hypothetical protein
MPTDRVTRALRIAKLAHSLGEYDTNVLGMVGEVVAEDVLGMRKAPKQSKDIDGHIVVNGIASSVQVKALSSARILSYGPGAKFRIAAGEHPQRLVVLLVRSKLARYQVLYDGPASAIGKIEMVSGTQRRGIRLGDIYNQRET